MKTHALFLTAGLLILSTACEKKEEEDLAFAYRSDYAGLFHLESITDAEGKAWDLNDDGIASLNIVEEVPANTAPDATFYFSETHDGQLYNGQLVFQFPVQEMHTDEKPPYTLDTPVLVGPYSFTAAGRTINMKLYKDGSTSWENFYMDPPAADARIYLQFLHGGSVDAVHDRQIDITIQQVLIYDFLEKKLILRPFRYHLVHE